MCPRAPSSSRRLQRRPRTPEARRAHRSSRVSYSLPPTPVRNLVKFPNEDSTTLAKRSQALDSPPRRSLMFFTTVLESIRARPPISRAEISRLAGISKPTVSLALQSLLDAGLVRETSAEPGRPSYGAVFFEPVPDAAFVLGLDLGARFLRGAICDLGGTIRARQDIEIRGADAEGALSAIGSLHDALIEVSDVPGELIDGAVVGVPGVVEAATGTLQLATNVPGLEGRAFGDEVSERLGLAVSLENDINLAALGERWLGVARGVDDFAFLSIGTGMGVGLVLGGKLHRGHNGAAGEVDWALAGIDEDVDPSAEGLPALIARIAADGAWETSLAALVDARAVFSAARSGDRLGRAVVEEVEWMPYPPRVETSSLGEAAVLTGALAVGVDSALDNVFVNRASAARA
ncbi:MAG: ROK family transcriptional regulator [Actinobacteria bacterium]|nr:MAG: ROK family transcriptional regulator [Actinomycetota bacterium]